MTFIYHAEENKNFRLLFQVTYLLPFLVSVYFRFEKRGSVDNLRLFLSMFGFDQVNLDG